MTFGEKLSKLRKENNFTQEQLADMLSVSRQSVSKWESNTAYPETEKLVCLAKLFDCSTDYLLIDECTIGKYSNNTTDIKTEHPTTTQKIIGCILLTVSLISGILTLLLAKSEEGLLLSLIVAVTLLICSFICLFVRQHAGYWCAWAGFAPFIVLSPHMVGLSFLARINITVICFCIIMFFIAKKIFKVNIVTNRKKSIHIILGWVFFAVLSLYLYAIPFFTIIEGSVINPNLYMLIDFIRYITVALLMTYTVCYVKSLKQK